jgi:hypothetical protein
MATVAHPPITSRQNRIKAFPKPLTNRVITFPLYSVIKGTSAWFLSNDELCGAPFASAPVIDYSLFPQSIFKLGGQSEVESHLETSFRLITEKGYRIAEASRNLCIEYSILRRWKKQIADDRQNAFPGKGGLNDHRLR